MKSDNLPLRTLIWSAISFFSASRWSILVTSCLTSSTTFTISTGPFFFTVDSFFGFCWLCFATISKTSAMFRSASLCRWICTVPIRVTILFRMLLYTSAKSGCRVLAYITTHLLFELVHELCSLVLLQKITMTYHTCIITNNYISCIHKIKMPVKCQPRISEVKILVAY